MTFLYYNWHKYLIPRRLTFRKVGGRYIRGHIYRWLFFTWEH